MRRSGAWMTVWDDRILELLRERDSGTPTELSESKYIRVSSVQVGRRLKKLHEHGLVQHLGNGVYIITDRGEQYLDGEISTFEDEPDQVPSSEDEETNGGVPSPSGPG